MTNLNFTKICFKRVIHSCNRRIVPAMLTLGNIIIQRKLQKILLKVKGKGNTYPFKFNLELDK